LRDLGVRVLDGQPGARRGRRVRRAWSRRRWRKRRERQRGERQRGERQRGERREGGGGGEAGGGRGAGARGGARGRGGGAGSGGSVGTDPDLVLLYRFDEAAGSSAADSSGFAGGPRNGALTTVGAGMALFSDTHQVGTHGLMLVGSGSADGGFVVIPSLQTLA